MYRGSLHERPLSRLRAMEPAVGGVAGDDDLVAPRGAVVGASPQDDVDEVGQVAGGVVAAVGHGDDRSVGGRHEGRDAVEFRSVVTRCEEFRVAGFADVCLGPCGRFFRDFGNPCVKHRVFLCCGPGGGSCRICGMCFCGLCRGPGGRDGERVEPRCEKREDDKLFHIFHMAGGYYFYKDNRKTDISNY